MQKQDAHNSSESMKKSIIFRLTEKEFRPFRTGFARYLSVKYGMNINTSYGKLGKGRWRQWEIEGIAGCIARYSPEYAGRPCNFYEALPVKWDFVKFMKSECGMCESTARRRFSIFDFTELEIKGLEAIYHEYMAMGGAQP